ncbi:Maff2 family protein, partial [Dysosmobacter welbionis]
TRSTWPWACWWVPAVPPQSWGSRWRPDT